MTRNNLDEHLTWLLRNAGVSRPVISPQQVNYTGTANQIRVNDLQRQGSGSAFEKGKDIPYESELEKQRVPSLVTKQKQLLTPGSVTHSGRFEQTYSQFLKNRP